MSTGTRQHAGQRGAFQTFACAISGVAAALLLLAVGCQNEDLNPDTGLNPRPEELPSANSAPEGAGISPDVPPSPVRETCDDNPALAGCEPPSGGAAEPPADSEPAPVDVNGAPGDAGSDMTALDAGAGALLAGDATAP